MTKLGQHFLIAKRKIEKIIDALELREGDTIIEIGPGHGELTEELANKLKSLKAEKFRIIAIEKDIVLADKLKSLNPPAGGEKFKNVEIIHGDILKILPKLSQSSILNSQSYKIVGNIPYYITGYLFRILGELEVKPSLIVLMIQKEVAERIIAKPPKMNLLAASVQFWAEPRIIGNVSRKYFRPMPKVDSAIVKLVIKQLSNYEITQLPNYYHFIKILFKQPRKTILNNLKFRIKNLELRTKNKQKLKEKLLKVGVDPQARPQDLSIERIIELSTLF